MIYKNGNRRILVNSQLSEQETQEIVRKVENKDFQLVEVLKDHSRSRVLRIALNNLDLVLKVPIEKNKKPWIRFLTIFRKSEAFKNLMGMRFLSTLGFKTTNGYLACEYRNWGMVTDSWVLYFFLKAQECLDQNPTFTRVVHALGQLHKKDVLHGDAQIRNFLISEGEIYFIDANPKKSRSALAKAHEYAYLKRSQPDIEPLFPSTIKYYKLAVRLDIFDRKVARLRRTIKKITGLRN
ncbi:MAG: lipopolysaccharide core heptose(II) kinase RfaY [Bacteroidota bacterium]